MFRLPGERVPVVIDEGPFAGASCEVTRIESWLMQQTAARLLAAFLAVPESQPAKQIEALSELLPVFVAEAQPSWDLSDHRGPIPPTLSGLWRLPLPLALRFIDEWVDPPAPPSTAVDELVPPGPLRDELNAGLRQKKRSKTEG